MRKETLGVRMRTHRAAAQISQAVLAGLLGPKVTQEMICHWEKGKYDPGPKYAARIKTFLSADPATLCIMAEKAGLLRERKARGKKPMGRRLKPGRVPG